MADWKIHRKEEACKSCSRGFEEGESFYSVLAFSAEGLARDDHCAPCFQERGVEETDGEAPIWWRTRRQPDQKRSLAVDFEAIEALFLALEGRDEERLAELRYLLSLLLMRKRRIKLVRIRRENGEERMIVRRPRRTEELSVQVFDLTPERAKVLRAELEGIIEGAGAEDVLAGPPAAAASPASPNGAEEPPQDAEETASSGESAGGEVAPDGPVATELAEPS